MFDLFSYWVAGGVGLGVIVLYYLWTRVIFGGTSYWAKRGVHVIPSSTSLPGSVSFIQQIRSKAPFHSMDVQTYNYIKSQGNLNFGGRVEFGTPTLYVVNPDLIRTVLVKNFDHFVDRRKLGTSPDSKNTLFSMEGLAWRRARSTLSPTFTTGRIRRMFPIFKHSGDRLIEYIQDDLEQKTETELPLRLRPYLSKYVFDVIAAAAFGLDSGSFSRGQPETMFQLKAGKLINFGQVSISFYLKFLFYSLCPKLCEILGIRVIDPQFNDYFKSVVSETIKARELDPKLVRDDFLQLLIDTKNGQLKEVKGEEGSVEDSVPTVDGESSGVMVPSSGRRTEKALLTEELLLGSCIQFFGAGFHTIESMLTFALYELAINPEIQEKLFDEIEAGIQQDSRSSDGQLTYEAVNNMKYLEMIVTETLRKYPPIPRLERVCTEDFKEPESGVVIEKGTLIVIQTYAIQHDPDIYPEPDKFIPERFSSEGKATRHPYTYMPFGLGPRGCIAIRFALQEGRAALANLVHNFSFAPSEKTLVPMEFGQSIVSLKPLDDLWLRITPRK